jgi:membrane-bound lytic murein transglycosylase B
VPAQPLPPVAKRTIRAAVAITAAVLLSGVGSAASADRSAAGGVRAVAVAVAPTGSTAGGLSAGAPTGALVVAAEPTLVATPAPVIVTVISGLAANGIPNVALNAYRVAAARLASADPGCGIQWPLLAGIGRVESDHGQFAGATLNADGTSTPKIIGPALDGKSYPYIGDTDHGALDGDPVYDHAVGPMQFIPSTWKAYASDGNGDGIDDPFNINDAALAAARYLCAAGGDLGTAAGQSRAVLAYNHSDEYVAEVLALAAEYASGVPVTGIPVGATTGPLPPVTWSGSGSIPPANPSVPPALAAAAPTTSASGPTTGGGSSSSSGGSGSSGGPGTSGGSGSTGGAGGTGGSGGTGGTGGSGAPAPTSATTGQAPTLPGLPIPLPSLPALPIPLPTPSVPAPVAGTTSAAPNPVGSLVCTLLGLVVQC